MFALVRSLRLFIVGAYKSVKTTARLVEAGENLSMGCHELSLSCEALEDGVMKGDDVVNQPFEESSLVVSGVNGVPSLHFLNPI